MIASDGSRHLHGICPLMEVGNEFNLYSILQKLSHVERTAPCGGRCLVRVRRADVDGAKTEAWQCL